MRILAIRGCNLASLAGEFEIDLAGGALGAAGVFAIVGPTGAGKSTLLDAMCVALFQRTPRLANRSTVVVGRGDDDPTALGSQDVRTLLRRGASQGYAEVDFESGDSRRYRARWSVRRARGSIEGRFQDDQMSLVSLDGAQYGGTKSETLRAIRDRLGLSFDQFRRSALLAQGDFAAFLKAEGRERSELLERMTGTEIYSRLSVAAHAKAALAEQQLRARHGAAMAIAVLADGARAAAEAELELARDARGAARARMATAERAAAWLAEADRRRLAVGEAEAARTAAEAAVAATAPERTELALRRRAEALRPPWDEVARLERQLAHARAEAAQAADAAAVAAGQQRSIATHRDQLAAVHAPVREARIAAGIRERTRGRDESAGLVERAARGRDESAGLVERAARSRDESAGWVERAARSRDESAGWVERAARGHDESAGLVERASRARDDAAWLLARASLSTEIAAWPELDARFSQHAQLAIELARIDGALVEQAAARAALDAQRETAVRQHRAATDRLGEAQREAASFHQKRGVSLDAAGRQEDTARHHVTEIDRLSGLVGEARGAATARAELDRQLAVLTAAATADAEQRRIAEFERSSSAALRADRAHVVDQLRRAAGYQHARAELATGEPCPLCGAKEHPWRDRGAFDTLITDAEARLTEAAARGEAAIALLAHLAARDEQRGVERARLVACRATAEATAVAAQIAWKQQLAALGELLLIEEPASDAARQLVDERVEAARQRLEIARRARSEAEAVAKASADANARVHARQTEVEHHAETVRGLAAAIAAHNASAERQRGERAGKLERHAELTRSIADSLSRWIAALPSTDATPIAAGRSALLPAADASAILASHSAVMPASISDHSSTHALPATEPAKEPARKRSAKSRTARGTQPPPTATDVASCSPAQAADARGGAIASSSPAQAADARGGAIASSSPAQAADARGGAIASSSPAQLLADARGALGAIAAAWRVHAEIVGELDATLVAALASIDTAAREADRAFAEHSTRRDEADRRRESLVAELTAASARLETERVAAGFEVTTLRELLAAEPGRVDALASRLDALDRAADRARTLVAERARLVADHDAVRPFALDEDGTPRRLEAGVPLAPADAAVIADAARTAELAAAVAQAEAHAATLAATLAADADARARRAAALAEADTAEKAAEVDRVLGEVIGSHDGKLFRSFAQSLTLDGLLAVANSHLEELAPRYQLERVPKHDLELQVIDRDLGGEVRSVQSLSGGESFLVSLALALGLSSMSAHDVRVRTLLIDEGFGTLDPATLDAALAVLDALQATGRQVGVISHVPALVERVGAHVRVFPRGGGRSEVVVAQA